MGKGGAGEPRVADESNWNSNRLHARLADTSLHLTSLYFARVAKIIHSLRWRLHVFFSILTGRGFAVSRPIV